MSKFIAVIDYEAGNAPSVLNALRRLGIPAKIAAEPEEAVKAGAIILPGVGAAGETMASITKSGLKSALEERVIKAGVPFLGICVGLQILFEHSEEGGGVKCLGWLKGVVRRFDEFSLRVPQIGWNAVVPVKRDKLWNGLDNPEYFYFVNSYYARPIAGWDLLAQADYGGPFCAMVKRGNITGAQFHMEKSGEAGLKMLKNFASEAGVC